MGTDTAGGRDLLVLERRQLIGRQILVPLDPIRNSRGLEQLKLFPGP